MIGDSPLFVECDGCQERIDFTFSLVLSSGGWAGSDLFNGWDIDWSGSSGDSLCPSCKGRIENDE